MNKLLPFPWIQYILFCGNYSRLYFTQLSHHLYTVVMNNPFNETKRKRENEKCGDKNVLFIKASEKTKTRTAISGGKRPNPSDLGS